MGDHEVADWDLQKVMKWVVYLDSMREILKVAWTEKRLDGDLAKKTVAWTVEGSAVRMATLWVVSSDLSKGD